jgi:hypothetical protein
MRDVHLTMLDMIIEVRRCDLLSRKGVCDGYATSRDGAAAVGSLNYSKGRRCATIQNLGFQMVAKT